MTVGTVRKLPALAARVFRIIFIEKRIPGRLLQLYYNFLSFFGKKTVYIQTTDGMNVKCFTKTVTIFVEVFQKEDYSFPDFKLDQGMTVIDIGANQGFFSLYAANRGAKVYAFEPCVENLVILRENVASNGFEDRIHVIDCAVTGDKKSVDLFVGKDSRGDVLSGSVSTVNDNRGGVSVLKRSVRGIPINDLFTEFDIERCDLLKMDCEGAEYEIFAHISDKSLEKIPRIVVEVHQGRGEELVAKLETWGYEIKHKEFDEAGLVKALRVAGSMPLRSEPA